MLKKVWWVYRSAGGGTLSFFLSARGAKDPLLENAVLDLPTARLALPLTQDR